MGLIASLKTWIDNEILTATDLNASFAEIRNTVNTFGAFKDQPNTFTQPNTFSQGATVANGLTVTGGANVTGGATVTGAVAITGAASVSAGLTVAGGGAAVTGNSSVTGDLAVSGTVTGGTIVVPAAGVQPGAFPSGHFNMDGTLTSNAVIVDNGQLRGARVTQSGAGGIVSFSGGNHVRHTMTGNGTLTLAGGVAGGVYTVEVLQDGTGGRTVAWSGAVWPAGVAPTSTTTANRKDVFTFYFDGTHYLGVVFGQNYASPA